MKPTRLARVAVSAVIGLLAGALHYAQHITESHHTDFGPTWFGARSIIAGVNPYELVGPGLPFDWPWSLLYPATGMVAALPLAGLSERLASVFFVSVSSALLAYAVSRTGWHRLPLFLSASFVVAAKSAQWSPLIAAGFCMPGVAWAFACKPNIGAAALAAMPSLSVMRVAIVGGITLALASFALLPSWPLDWLEALRTAGHMSAPITWPGGVVVLFALLRWRRPEARLIVAMACVPQTPNWYEALPLLLVPATLLQSLVLSLISSLGFLYEWLLYRPNATYVDIEPLMIALVYLPATLLVLRRQNEGNVPQWSAIRVPEALRRGASRKTEDGS